MPPPPEAAGAVVPVGWHQQPAELLPGRGGHQGRVLVLRPGALDADGTAWDQLIRDQLDAGTRPCKLVQRLPRLKVAP